MLFRSPPASGRPAACTPITLLRQLPGPPYQTPPGFPITPWRRWIKGREKINFRLKATARGILHSLTLQLPHARGPSSGATPAVPPPRGSTLRRYRDTCGAATVPGCRSRRGHPAAGPADAGRRQSGGKAGIERTKAGSGQKPGMWAQEEARGWGGGGGGERRPRNLMSEGQTWP